MRLATRKIRIWNESYIHYRYLWRNLGAACAEARASRKISHPVLLDIGCGHKPYSDMFPDWHHFGINQTITDASPDVVGDALRLPFQSGIADAVLCTQVLEHVKRPPELVRECARVLKPGGALILSAPFYWPIHEAPYDYFRFTIYGLQELITDSGLQLDWIRPDGGDGARVILSLLHSLPRFLSIPMRIPLNIAGLAIDKIAPQQTLPLNYTLLAYLR